MFLLSRSNRGSYFACTFRGGGRGQQVPQAQRRVKGFVDSWRNAGEVAYLPAAPRLGFAVEVQGCAGIGKEGLPAPYTTGPQISEQVLHDDRGTHGGVAQKRGQPGSQRRVVDREHAAANSAALAAPASPIAKVALGIPRGICTMDSSESMPLR